MKTTHLLSADPLPTLRPALLAYVGPLLMVALCTLMGMFIAAHWGTTPVVLLYLPPVLTAAIYCGLRPALVAAVASTQAYNFYFTAPYRSLLIHNPADVVTVVLLFLVAVVTSQLAASLRRQARLAAAHASRNATIAGFARRLLSCTGEAEIAEVAVGELAMLFDCEAVLLREPDETQLIASAPRGVSLAPSDLAAAALTLATGEASGRGVRHVDCADWQFRAVESDRAVIAAVGLARVDGRPPVHELQLPLLGNLLDQVALALERARLDREARDIATLRERDGLRSALLKSIGEDVKPRLRAIASAAGVLRRNGIADKSVAGQISSETAMLERYVDNLVDLEPGAVPDPIHAGDVTIDLHRRLVTKAGGEVHLTPKEFAVLAELAKHRDRVLTHAQLLRSVWGPAQQDQIDYLRVAIRALRQKLEPDPVHPSLILNEPAVGYRLTSGSSVSPFSS